MPEGSSPKRTQTRLAGKKVRADGTVPHARYSKKLTGEICLRIAGGELWHKICNTGHLPSYTTLYDWLRKYPDFAEDFAQAKEMAADLRADKVLVVAEESTAATVQSDRLRVGALQWHAGKAAPKRYGSKAGDGVNEGEPRELIIRIRQFERAWREDGTPYVREVRPCEGDAE